jgi:serine/threonine protein kinase
VSSPERSLGLAPRVIKARYRLIAVSAVSRDVVVYAAEDARGGRPVAVEFVRDEFAGNVDYLTALWDQARKLAKLEPVKSAIARVYECDRTEDGDVFVVREPVDGRPLREVLDEAGAFDPATALRIAGQIGEGLEMLHQRGIVHGELGLDSVVMVKGDDGMENPRLVGVELTGAHRTAAGRRLGEGATLPYPAPEQLEGGHQINEAVDVYALGRLLRELLTGTGARNGAGVGTQPVPLTVASIIETAVASRPSRRYADISLMLNAIWDAHTAVTAPASRLLGIRVTRPTLAVASAVAAVGIVVAVSLWSGMADRVAARFSSRVTTPALVPPSATSTPPTPAAQPSPEAGTPRPSVAETPAPASKPESGDSATSTPPLAVGPPVSRPSSPAPSVSPERPSGAESRPTLPSVTPAPKPPAPAPAVVTPKPSSPTVATTPERATERTTPSLPSVTPAPKPPAPPAAVVAPKPSTPTAATTPERATERTTPSLPSVTPVPKPPVPPAAVVGPKPSAPTAATAPERAPERITPSLPSVTPPPKPPTPAPAVVAPKPSTPTVTGAPERAAGAELRAPTSGERRPAAAEQRPSTTPTPRASTPTEPRRPAPVEATPGSGSEPADGSAIIDWLLKDRR